MKFIQNKKVLYSLLIIIVLFFVIGFFPSSKLVWSDPGEGGTKQKCEAQLLANYGGVCTCVLKTVPWSNYQAWFGDKNSCVNQDSKISDGGCFRASGNNGAENCLSGSYHIDYTCSAGGRCGVGDDKLPPKPSDNTGCSPGGDFKDVVVPSQSKQSATYDVTGTFTASCNGYYYIEAYQDKSSFKALSVVSSDKGICDNNIGTAGIEKNMVKGESVSFDLKLTDYGNPGSYNVVLGVYNGCAAILSDDFKVYDTVTKGIKIYVVDPVTGTQTSNVNTGGLTGWVKYVLYLGGGIVAIFLLIILLVLIPWRKK
jgi:hypothetical protein